MPEEGSGSQRNGGSTRVWPCMLDVHKASGRRRRGAPPPLPTAQPGRPPAAWLSPSPGAGAASPPLPARQIRGRAGSCIINSTASLPVFTLITCWGGQVGGREQGGKPWSLEGPSALSKAALWGLAQPQVSEVGFWSFPHQSPQEGTRALRREFM